MLSALLRAARLAYYRWAAREMPPWHPDLTYVLQRIAQLQEQRRTARDPGVRRHQQRKSKP